MKMEGHADIPWGSSSNLPRREAFVFRKMQAWRGEKTMMQMEGNRHEDEGI